MPRVRTPARTRAWRRGRAAEAAAAIWLTIRGYRVASRRLRTPVGEIDLVVTRGPVVAIVEVKARAGLALAAEAVSPRQRRRLERAAAWWIARRPELRDRQVRFDVVLIAPWCLPRHLVDAWRPHASL